MALADNFLDLPIDKFAQRLAVGAEGEDDLAAEFRRARWPVVHLGRAEAGAHHPPLWVGDRCIKLPDMLVTIPGIGQLYIEARTKRRGVIRGTDCYGMNTGKGGCTDRLRELLLVEQHAAAALAIYDPAHGWMLATVAKLVAFDLEKDRSGTWWLIPRRLLTPLECIIGGDLRRGLVLNGRMV